MKIQESGENYLETILLLYRKHGYVRSIDVANELAFSKPSVSRAMGILKDQELITMEPGGGILLTQKGMDLATSVYERHCTISRFLMQTLGVEQEIANKDACRIEHIISPETFESMKHFVHKLDR